VTRAPAGFVRIDCNEGEFIAHQDIAGRVLAAGLDKPWELVEPRPPGPGTGRGPRAVVPLPGEPRLLVKQYLRGGVPARWNRERYASPRRFLRELEVGQLARAAGLPVGEALGVVLVPARPGWRAWGMARFIEEAPDLASRLTRERDARVREAIWRAALDAVSRWHDAGLDHPDLNLGNLLVRPRENGAGWDIFLVDLDRARWLGVPLAAHRRARAHARLERSLRKICGQLAPR